MPLRRPPHSPAAFEDLVKDIPGPPLDLQTGPQPEPHLVAIADVDMPESGRSVDFVAGGDGHPGPSQFPRKTGKMRNKIVPAPLRGGSPVY